MKHRLKVAALAASAAVALSVPVAAHGANAATTAPRSSGQFCQFANANLHFRYFTADQSPYGTMNWWGPPGSAAAGQGSPIELEPPSGSSDQDCFKPVEGGGGSPPEFQLQYFHQQGLCLNVAGNSHNSGAWIITYACNPITANTLFQFFTSNLNNGSDYIVSVSSGLCIDLSNGFKAGSILVQKPCSNADPWQSWQAS